MKVKRLATLRNLNSSMKVPITTVWLGAVRVDMPAVGALRRPRAGLAPKAAKASAPTRAEAKTKALANIFCDENPFRFLCRKIPRIA